MMRLEVRSLAVDLGARRVLQGIDMSLEPRCLTALIGPNGAGKTTLLRAIAYLPQGGGVAWPLPVANVVALGRLPHGEEPDDLPAEGRKAVVSALLSVGLEGFEARPATSLSGGERARMLLARALATQAPVLLADEPVAALDPRHQLIVLDVLKAHARAGATVVAILHDLNLAARFADHIVLLDQGKIEAFGSPETVLTEARIAASFGIQARIAREDNCLLVVAQSPLPDA